MKFSIILPVKNGGEYVKQCIESIRNQTIDNHNIIVLDNASTDGTPDYIRSLNDSRITIYQVDKSLNIEQNWARVVQVQKNEFMTVIGHDDILYPNYLEEMEKLIEKHPSASLYQAHYHFIDSEGKKTGPCLPMDEIQKAHEFIATHMMNTMNSMGTGYMMRSKDYDEVGGIPDYPNLIFGDYELWIKLTLKNYKATSLRELFSYRVHNSVSRLTSGEAYQHAFERYVRFIYQLSQSDHEVKVIINRYGKKFMLDYCESLSHRLLKTQVESRRTTVAAFIDKCKELANLLIPHEDFEPLKIKRIRLAKQLDSNTFTRKAFLLFKKIR